MDKLDIKEKEDFLALLGRLAEDPRTLEMKKYIQHGKVTTYYHCLKVAATAFRYNRRFGLNGNEEEIVRAAFLHDYYLYDWHCHDGHLHGYRHPFVAARNARRDFDISDREKEIIETHMWPLTLTHVPPTKEAWIVSLADKTCSTKETLFMREFPEL